MDFRKRTVNWLVTDVGLSRAVAKVLGLKADFQSIDWSMKETELKNGTIDCNLERLYSYSIPTKTNCILAEFMSYLANHWWYEKIVKLKISRI